MKDNVLEVISFVKNLIEDKMKTKTLGKRFSGKIHFTVNLHDGGITRTSSTIEQDLLLKKDSCK